MSADHTRLKGLTEIGSALLSDQLETNLVSFFNWGLLGVGAFFNVSIPTSGAFGGDKHRLRLATDPYYDDGQVWQGYRQDWVWETGVDYSVQPIRVSGVRVNGTFYPSSTTGVYKHHVDYPQGRIVFDAAINPSSVVTCEYSHRYVHFTHSDAPWWRQVQLDSFRVDDEHFAQQGSGAWAVLSKNRVQLPAVVVEAVPNTTRSPLMIGGGAKVRQDVLFTVLSETPGERKQLHDVVTYQWGKRTILFEKNWVADANRYPLDENGTPVPSGLMYPDLVKATGEGGFGWKQLRFEDFKSVAQPTEVTSPLYVATIRGTFEVDM